MIRINLYVLLAVLLTFPGVKLIYVFIVFNVYRFTRVEIYNIFVLSIIQTKYYNDSFYDFPLFNKFWTYFLCKKKAGYRFNEYLKSDLYPILLKMVFVLVFLF